MNKLLYPLVLLACSVSANPDLNGDGIVTVTDFQLFMPMLHDNNLEADFNDDGAVTVTDFLLLRNQLNGPPIPVIAVLRTVGAGVNQIRIPREICKPGVCFNVAAFDTSGNEGIPKKYCLTAADVESCKE